MKPMQSSWLATIRPADLPLYTAAVAQFGDRDLSMRLNHGRLDRQIAALAQPQAEQP